VQFLNVPSRQLPVGGYNTEGSTDPGLGLWGLHYPRFRYFSLRRTLYPIGTLYPSETEIGSFSGWLQWSGRNARSGILPRDLLQALLTVRFSKGRILAQGRGDKVSVSYYAACYGVERVAKPRRAECFRLQEALQGWTAKSGGKTRS